MKGVEVELGMLKVVILSPRSEYTLPEFSEI